MTDLFVGGGPVTPDHPGVRAPAMPAVRMSLADLHVTRTLQPRGGEMCADTVREYAAAAKAGAAFPPLVAYRVSDRKFGRPALVAGFHRHAAFLRAGLGEAEVEVRDGTFAEAWLAGWASNLTNGLRYTNAQKRHAAETGLLLFRTESAPQVADRLGVSDEFVRKVRKELAATGKLDPKETATGRDGKNYPTRLKGPTVGPSAAGGADARAPAHDASRDEQESVTKSTLVAFVRGCVRGWEESLPTRVSPADGHAAVQTLVGMLTDKADALCGCPPTSPPEAGAKVLGVGVIVGHEAINCLIRIPKNDPLRTQGLRLVTDWINANP